MSIQGIYEKWVEVVEAERKSGGDKKAEIKPSDLGDVEGIVVRSGIKAGEYSTVYFAQPKKDFRPW